jgi:hypothetical protein
MKNFAKKVFSLKKKGDEQIVVKLVLIGVAVVLAFLFKASITDLLSNSFDSLGQSVGLMMSGS